MYLKFLARLAHILREQGACEILVNAKTPAKSLAFFEKCGQGPGEMAAFDGVPRVCGAGAGGLAMAGHFSRSATPAFAGPGVSARGSVHALR